MIQKERLLNLLQNNWNNYVSVWDIITKCHICHYTQVISDLRDLWYIIENKVEWKVKHWEKVKYSWYKLVMPEIKPLNWLQRLFR